MGLVSNGFPSFKLSLSVDSFHKLARETVSHDITQSQRSHLPIHSFALSEFVRAFTIQLFTMTMFILHHCGCAQIESENWEVSETIFVGSAERVLSIFSQCWPWEGQSTPTSRHVLFFSRLISRVSVIFDIFCLSQHFFILCMFYIFLFRDDEAHSSWEIREDPHWKSGISLDDNGARFIGAAAVEQSLSAILGNKVDCVFLALIPCNLDEHSNVAKKIVGFRHLNSVWAREREERDHFYALINSKLKFVMLVMQHDRARREIKAHSKRTASLRVDRRSYFFFSGGLSLHLLVHFT